MPLNLTNTTKAQIDAALGMFRTDPASISKEGAVQAAALFIQGKLADAQAVSDLEAEILAQHNAYLSTNYVNPGSGNTPADVDGVEAWRQDAIKRHAVAYASDRAKSFAAVDAVIATVEAAGIAAAGGGPAALPAVMQAVSTLAPVFEAYGNTGDVSAFDSLLPAPKL